MLQATSMQHIPHEAAYALACDAVRQCITQGALAGSSASEGFLCRGMAGQHCSVSCTLWHRACVCVCVCVCVCRRDMAGPHQKEAAIRAAAGAVRPWSAYAGLGERRGAQFAQALAQVAITDINVPSRFQPPNATYAENVAAAAKRVRSLRTLTSHHPYTDTWIRSECFMHDPGSSRQA